jgi:hypothetical protein
MAESNENKVVSGGLVISARPQVSVELRSDGDVVISSASIADNYQDVELDAVRFPIDCAREIAAELIRLADLADSQAR